MLVGELVSILEEQIPDYSRQALLDEIVYVQREVFSSRLNYNRAYDASTGLDPQITPTTNAHTIADASSISHVYITDDTCPLSVLIQGNTIIFSDSQLNSAYYVRYYTKPTEYLTEGDTLYIPEDLVSMLEDGVSARVQYKQHGKIDTWLMWKKIELPQLRRKLNKNYSWSRGNGTKTVQSYK